MARLTGFEDVKRVAERGLRAAREGRALCIPSADMRALYVATKMLPYPLALAVEARCCSAGASYQVPDFRHMRVTVPNFRHMRKIGTKNRSYACPHTHMTRFRHLGKRHAAEKGAHGREERPLGASSARGA